VKRGEDGCMHVIGYCNSPLNNKNIDYHCPVVFSRIGFPHKSLCQLFLKTTIIFLIPCKHGLIGEQVKREEDMRKVSIEEIIEIDTPMKSFKFVAKDGVG
jgi:hypothetical protein